MHKADETIETHKLTGTEFQKCSLQNDEFMFRPIKTCKIID